MEPQFSWLLYHCTSELNLGSFSASSSSSSSEPHRKANSWSVKALGGVVEGFFNANVDLQPHPMDLSHLFSPLTLWRTCKSNINNRNRVGLTGCVIQIDVHEVWLIADGPAIELSHCISIILLKPTNERTNDLNAQSSKKRRVLYKFISTDATSTCKWVWLLGEHLPIIYRSLYAEFRGETEKRRTFSHVAEYFNLFPLGNRQPHTFAKKTKTTLALGLPDTPQLTSPRVFKGPFNSSKFK